MFNFSKKVAAKRIASGIMDITLLFNRHSKELIIPLYKPGYQLVISNYKDEVSPEELTLASWVTITIKNKYKLESIYPYGNCCFYTNFSPKIGDINTLWELEGFIMDNLGIFIDTAELQSNKELPTHQPKKGRTTAPDRRVPLNEASRSFEIFDPEEDRDMQNFIMGGE